LHKCFAYQNFLSLEFSRKMAVIFYLRNNPFTYLWVIQGFWIVRITDGTEQPASAAIAEYESDCMLWFGALVSVFHLFFCSLYEFPESLVLLPFIQV
jgi:hypothetical protein